MEEIREIEPEIKVSTNPSLPDALLFAEILPKLPLKSLMQFKCVSKPWKSLISSTKFAKLMLHLSNSEPHNHGVLIQTGSSLYAVPNYACYDESSNLSFELLKMRFDHHGFKEGSFDLLDSSNGLVCFRPSKKKYDDMCVWNPFTQECRRIPGFHNKYKYVMFQPSIWAFGYAPSLDDYKIVNSCFMFDVHTKKRATVTRVFSLRNDVWEEFETDVPLGVNSEIFRDNGVVLPNGKCHWLLIELANADDVPSVHILAFDLVTKTFNLMMLPQQLNGDDKKKRDLRERACIGSIEENLCVASQGLGQFLEVWAMERYGEGESWTKLLKVSGLMTPAAGQLKFCTLCTYAGCVKLLMHLKEQVWFYDWSDSNPKCDRVEGLPTFHTRRFVPSLISPFMMEVEDH